MNFLQVWLFGYRSPVRFARALLETSSPRWGLISVILRSLMDSLLLYLPVALLGRIPPTPSYLTFLSTEKYYLSLVWLTPLVFLTQWLFSAAVLYLFLRMQKLTSNRDRLLNLTGLAGLVVGSFLVLWDWLWFFVGGANQYSLGISHLLIDIWWFVLVVTGLKELLGIPVRTGVVASLLAFIAAMPFAVIIMRAPF